MQLFLRKIEGLYDNKKGDSFEKVIFYNHFQYHLCKSTENLAGQPMLVKVYIHWEEIEYHFLGSGVLCPVPISCFSGQSLASQSPPHCPQREAGQARDSPSLGH